MLNTILFAGLALAVPTAVPITAPSGTGVALGAAHTPTPSPTQDLGPSVYYVRACVLDLIEVEVPNHINGPVYQDRVRKTESEVNYQVLCVDTSGPLTRLAARGALGEAATHGIRLTYGGYASTANDVFWPASKVLKAWVYVKSAD